LPTADLGNVKIYYEVHGEGYPLLMIPGFSGSSEGWNQLEPRASDLSKQHKVILIDSRGTGRSSVPPSEYSIEEMADGAADLLNYLKITKAHVLGNALGGMIAQELAIKYPNLINGLILVATSPGGFLYDLPGQRVNLDKLSWLFKPPLGMRPEEVRFQVLQLAYSKSYLERNRDQILSTTTKYPTSLAVLEKHFGAAIKFDATSRLGQIISTTLILHGEDDEILFSDAARFLNKNILDSKLKIFRDTGHGVSVERWSEVKPMILSFLKGLD
jgi:pimeloyl-ACP methyl ester carboxylesterase